MKKILILLILLVTYPALAATYYIDYNAGNDADLGTSTVTAWKTHPGMANTAVSGYSHSNGDKFIFKGGVTWPYACFPLTIANSGASGSVDEYTGGQLEGSPWGTGKPIFDGGETQITGATGIITASSKSYLKFNGLKITNVGDRNNDKEWTGSNGGGRAFTLTNCENIEISYCDLHPYGSHVVVAAFTGGAESTYSNFLIHHNDIAYHANSLEFGGTGSETVAGVKIYNNSFHDQYIALVNGDHGDNFHQWNTTFTTFEFYNNKFYGNNLPRDSATGHTADVFCATGCPGGKIYNNVWSTDQDITDWRATLGGFAWTNYSGNVWYLDFSGLAVPSTGINGTILTMYINNSDAGAAQDNVGALDANGEWWFGNTGSPNYNTLYVYDDSGDPDATRSYDYYQVYRNGFMYSPGVLDLYGAGYEIYSNTFDLRGWVIAGNESGAKSFNYSYGGAAECSATFKNNIVLGAYYANYFIYNTMGIENDNNIYTDFVNVGRISTTGSATLANWQTALGGCPNTGNDCSSSSGTAPTFTDMPDDMSLAVADAIAQNMGATLGSPYNVDILAVARPQGVAYDIGAYEYASGPPDPPAAPSGYMQGGGTSSGSGGGTGTITGD